MLVTITTGAIQGAGAEWTPGYTFTYSTGSQFKIAGFDVTQLFNVGRRIRFTNAGNTLYGEVASRSFATDTTINMTMESAGVLLNVAYTITLVSGETSWSPIATNPFAGTSINAIVSGSIGATVYWQAVGDAGKVFYSTDAGRSWTAGTGYSSTVNFNGLAYNPVNKAFMVVGNDGVFMTSTNGTSWTIDTTTIKALSFSGGGTEHCLDVTYDYDLELWLILWDRNTTTAGTATASQSDLATWTQRDTAAEGTWVEYLPFDTREHVFTDDFDELATLFASTSTAQSRWILLGTRPQCFAGYDNGNTGTGGITGAFGNIAGKLYTFTGLTPPTLDDLNFSNSVNGMAYTSAHGGGRFVAVMDLSVRQNRQG